MYEENIDTPEMVALYEDSLNEKKASKREKIISVISNFNFDNYNTASEWINLYIDDQSGYPVFNKKKNSVEVKLIYTSATDGVVNEIDFTLELFVYGKTIITSNSKVPDLCLLISQVISDSYLETIKVIYTNLKKRKPKKTAIVKRGIQLFNFSILEIVMMKSYRKISDKEQLQIDQKKAKLKEFIDLVSKMTEEELSLLKERISIINCDGHSLSLKNNALLDLQAERIGKTVSVVGGFQQWLNKGRAVRTGEKAFTILAPCNAKLAEGGSEENKIAFKCVSVFDLSQTDLARISHKTTFEN